MRVFIITDKAKLVGEEVKGVGVMKDEELKLEHAGPSGHFFSFLSCLVGVLTSSPGQLQTSCIYFCKVCGLCMLKRALEL